MDTSRRTFLGLALVGVVVCSTWAVGAAEEAGGDTVRLTLDVQGMH